MSHSDNPKQLIESNIQETILPILREHFDNYLRTQLKDETGIPYSGSIMIEDISLGEMLGPQGDFGHLDFTVKTTVDRRKIPLIVKCFDPSRIVDMAPLANAAEFMGQLLSEDTIVKMPRLLYFSHAQLAMFFEGLSSSIVPFFSSSIDFPQRYFHAGRALALIHDYTFFQVDYSRYLRKEFAAINHLPFFALETKGELKQLFKANERNVKVSYGGTRSFGNYLPENIYISRVDTPPSSPQVFVIDPSAMNVDTNSVDRFEDITNFFSWTALANLAIGGVLDREGIEDFLSQLGVTHFLSGYNSIFEPKTTVKLTELYGEQHTFGYHLSLCLLEMIPSALKDGILTEDQIHNLVEGIKCLLQEQFPI